MKRKNHTKLCVIAKVFSYVSNTRKRKNWSFSVVLSVFFSCFVGIGGTFTEQRTPSESKTNTLAGLMRFHRRRSHFNDKILFLIQNSCYTFKCFLFLNTFNEQNTNQKIEDKNKIKI